MKKKVAATMAVVFVTVFLLGSVVLVRLRMGDRQEALAFQITNNFSAVHNAISENVPQEQKPQRVLETYTQRTIGALEEELALYNHFHRRSQANQVWNDLLYYVDRMATKTLPEQNASEESRQKAEECLAMLEPYVRALLYTEDGKQYPSTAEGLQEGLKAACQMMDTPEYEQLYFDMIDILHEG